MSNKVPDSLNPFIEDVPHNVASEFDTLVQSMQMLLDSIRASSPHSVEKKIDHESWVTFFGLLIRVVFQMQGAKSNFSRVFHLYMHCEWVVTQMGRMRREARKK